MTLFNPSHFDIIHCLLTEVTICATLGYYSDVSLCSAYELCNVHVAWTTIPGNKGSDDICTFLSWIKFKIHLPLGSMLQPGDVTQVEFGFHSGVPDETIEQKLRQADMWALFTVSHKPSKSIRKSTVEIIASVHTHFCNGHRVSQKHRLGDEHRFRII